MRVIRQHQFDNDNPPWLHCISRCVRRAFLCGDGYEHRKQWLERRLRLLSRCFQVEVGAYAIMSNHIHVITRPRPQRCDALSPEQIATAYWCMRFDVDPVEDSEQNPVDQDQIDILANDAKFIADWRPRLGNIGWFMRALKEPLSHAANKEDECSGAFWDGRFRSIPLLDVAAIMTCMAYVDLNPIRAQIANMPEESDFTSVKVRIQQRRARQRAQQKREHGNMVAADKILQQQSIDPQKQTIAAGEFPVSPAKQPFSEQIYRSWLTPVAEMTSTQAGDPGYKLDTYLKLVDATGRLLRADKAGAISSELAEILSRLDSEWTVEQWLNTVGQPASIGGAVLGKLNSLAVEAKRRSKQWTQSRCRLFKGGRPKANEGAQQ